MKITLNDIEREAYKHSFIHNIDSRIKIFFIILIILFTVSLPRVDPSNIPRLFFIEFYLIILMFTAHLNPIYILIRYAAVLPFGLGIIIIQPFIRQSFFSSFTQYPLDLPLGLVITYEGLAFGFNLFLKFTVCVSTVILISSTTKMHDLVNGARKLGIPKEITILLTLMVRYLFLFWSVFKRIRIAQTSRLFNIWNKKTSRIWILKQIGYTISSIFIMAYEQGEKAYISMLCRGYGQNTAIIRSKSKLNFYDIIFSFFTFSILLISYFAF